MARTINDGDLIFLADKDSRRLRDVTFSKLVDEIDQVSPGVTSYESLTDKPSIEGVTLSGDKTFEELNLQSITNTDLENMLT